LPNGLSLNTTSGVISGTAGNSGSYSFTIRATDTDGDTADQAYTWVTNNVVPTSTGGTVTISSVQEGLSASYDVDTNFTFTTGSTFSAYSLASGSLPSGLSLNTSTGVISGTMGTVSSDTAYSFTIRGTDTNSDYVDQAYSWTITDTPFSATGGTITTSGGYKYHKFTSSASGASGFVPNKSGTVDVLVVAGGGGGGSTGNIQAGGGGGAGGFLSSTGVAVLGQSYSIVVGGGGLLGQSGTSWNGTNGSNTTALSLTAIGGGGGGGVQDHSGLSGGSGGGRSSGGGSGAGGAGTSGQGLAGGGAGTQGSPYVAGGGGGAGHKGYDILDHVDTPEGGVGLQWLDGNYYSGGGGAGERDTSYGPGYGGNGGGGNGGRRGGANTISGTANTGGGGGGGEGDASGANGANGGSGIVIIRYAI